MNGIVILKSYKAVVDSSWGFSWIGVIAGIVALVFTAIILYFAITKKDFSLLFYLLPVAIAIGGSITFFATATPTYAVRHEAYLSGEVNMTEFTEKYKVIEQDGLIFTIEDLEASNDLLD